MANDSYFQVVDDNETNILTIIKQEIVKLKHIQSHVLHER